MDITTKKETAVKEVFETDDKFNQMLEAMVEDEQKTNDYPDHFEYPTGLQFELTAKCNLRCKHCYNKSGENSRITKMTVDDWINLSKHIVSNGGIFQCILSGGEPLLLGDGLISIMDIFHEDKTTFTLISNGFLINKDWVEKFKKYKFNWFQISIDGHTPELHDEFRGTKGSFERAANAVYMLSKSGLHVRIAHTASKSTLNDLDKMADLAYRLGASSLILGEPMQSGRSIANQDETVFTAGERDYLYKKIGDLTLQYKYKMEVYRSSFIKNQLRRYQILPNSVAVIRPDGNVRLDCVAPFVIGNVLERPFTEIWREKSAKCWQNEKVTEYIKGIDRDKSFSCMMQNYVDEDILI